MDILVTSCDIMCTLTLKISAITNLPQQRHVTYQNAWLIEENCGMCSWTAIKPVILKSRVKYNHYRYHYLSNLLYLTKHTHTHSSPTDQHGPLIILSNTHTSTTHSCSQTLPNFTFIFYFYFFLNVSLALLSLLNPPSGAGIYRPSFIYLFLH